MKNSTTCLAGLYRNYSRIFEHKSIFKYLLIWSFLSFPFLSSAEETDIIGASTNCLNYSTFPFKNCHPIKHLTGVSMNSNLLRVPPVLSNLSDITESIRTNLYLLMDNGSTVLADGVYTEYNNLYHDSVTLEDATKMTNILENIALLRYGKTLAIERRPIIQASDTLFFKLWRTKQRNYQIEFVTDLATNVGLQAFFEDSYLKTSVALGLSDTIKINFFVNTDTASASTNRFKIIFKPKPLYTAPPLIFTAFNATQEGEKIAVKWRVENEADVSKYEVEKSMDGTNFSLVNTTLADTNDSGFGNYAWLDDTQVSRANYYRIKGITSNGISNTTSAIKVEASNTRGTFIVYPNPVKGNTVNLQFLDQRSGIYEVRIISVTGQVMYRHKLQVNSSNMSHSLKVGTDLAKGIYELEIRNPNNSSQVKTIMVK